MPSVLAVLGAAFAASAGWIGPGIAAATALRLGRDPLERLVIGVALGRILLVIATLLASAAGAPRALVAWAALGLVAGGWAVVATWRGRDLAPTGAGIAAPIAIAICCALLLVHAVTARSGVDHGGMLLFFGRDSANDPFVYGAYARALLERGLPLANPFAGGEPVPASHAIFGVLAGLAALGISSIPDLVYRVVPFSEFAALGVTAVALVRALGAPRAAWCLAPVALLAGDPSPLIQTIASALGFGVHRIDSFALFGPYLLAMNPITPGLQTLFTALLLLARVPRGAEPWIAGLLVGVLLEIKLFLWAPALAGLLLCAAWKPPAALRKPLRIAAGAALAVSLPSLLDKMRAIGGDGPGFGVCAGCLPRYLARAAWGDGELSPSIFRAGSAATADLVPALVAVVAVALGARALAIPELLRGARAGNASTPYRVLGAAGAVGMVLAMTAATPPHFLNTAQFSWVAVFGMAPLLAVACARWLAARRWLPLAAAALLAAPGAADVLLRLGYGAPLRFSISPEERALCDAIERAAAPADVVFEPSMLRDTDVPSPIPLLAGRPVHLSLLSAVDYLPPDARDARFSRVARFYAGTDALDARRALAESGAAFVVVPRGFAPPAAALEPLALAFENDAGKLYRVPISASVRP
jgi:hypothetical protein